jgi:HAD superfamily hydrolase (TIGR01509 family)
MGIVFDLWYTLICAEDHGLPRGGEIGGISSVLGLDRAAFAEYWATCFNEMHRGLRSPEDCVLNYVNGLGQTVNEAQRAALDAVWGYHDKAVLSPSLEVLDALKRLADRGLQLVVLSNAHEREMRHWAFSPLARHFLAARFSFRGGWLKPEPAAYGDALEALGVPSSRVVFIGDGASGELTGARAAGFRKVIFMRGILERQGIDETLLSSYITQADATIDTLRDLLLYVD